MALEQHPPGSHRDMRSDLANPGVMEGMMETYQQAKADVELLLAEAYANCQDGQARAAISAALDKIHAMWHTEWNPITTKDVIKEIISDKP